MTQVSSAVDVLWNLYMAHPEKLSKVDWEYLIRNRADALAREILIKNMHEHIKPAQDKYEQQWRIANQATLQRIGQCVADGGPVAYMDRIIVIKDCHVIEQGSHQSLLRKRGEYARLWKMQSGGFLQE